MILITGAAGFIGSALAAELNNKGHYNLVLCDDFSREDKERNWKTKAFIARIGRENLFDWLDKMHADVEVIFHMGARTDTTEQDEALLDHLNLHFTQKLWNQCSAYSIPLIYASSAATYGGGEHGYDDNHEVIHALKPMNPYGHSKNNFDIWAMQQPQQPPQWYGLKFFNVYGPNEYHKGRMASVVFHTFNQIKASGGGMKLFRSHRPDFKDGEQSRDFIYIKDVTNMLYWLWKNKVDDGLYNIGTGKARTFYDLAANTFTSQNLEPNISFIDTPEDIRDTYQYFTEADMTKLRTAGYDRAFYSLEDGILDYVQGYLGKSEVW